MNHDAPIIVLVKAVPGIFAPLFTAIAIQLADIAQMAQIAMFIGATMVSLASFVSIVRGWGWKRKDNEEKK